MEAIFNQFDDAGRIIRLRQGFENPDDKNAPEIGFVIAAFRDAQAASRAVNDPSSAGRRPAGCAGRGRHRTDVRHRH